jgi:hypothetical protein
MAVLRQIIIKKGFSKMIFFDHECTVGGRTYPVNSQVAESTLPADWVAGALAAGFVHRVGALTVNEPLRVPPAGGKVPKEVQDELDKALGK